MKHLKTYNESIKDFLKPKSGDDINKSLSNLSDEQKLFKGIEYELDWLIDLSLDNLKNSHIIPLKASEFSILISKNRLSFTNDEKEKIDNILKSESTTMSKYKYDYISINNTLMYSLVINGKGGFVNWYIIQFDKYITVNICKNSQHRDGYLLLLKFDDLLKYLKENK